MSYTMGYGLFHWTGSGVYKEAECVKHYKTIGGADRAASRIYEKDNSSDLVARSFYKSA
jgi:hypothetical protein